MFLVETIKRIILCLITSGQRCDVAKWSPEQLTAIRDLRSGAGFSKGVIVTINISGFSLTSLTNMSDSKTFKANSGFGNIGGNGVPTIIKINVLRQ